MVGGPEVGRSWVPMIRGPTILSGSLYWVESSVRESRGRIGGSVSRYGGSLRKGGKTVLLGVLCQNGWSYDKIA
jgi:hypothetical protein